MVTVPAQSFVAPVRAVVIAARRCIPRVCAVVSSISLACTMRTPFCRHRLLESVMLGPAVTNGLSDLVPLEEPSSVIRCQCVMNSDIGFVEQRQRRLRTLFWNQQLHSGRAAFHTHVNADDHRGDAGALQRD